jgi:hypothetical protein
MLKSLNLSRDDVVKFILGERNDLRTTVERLLVAANEGTNLEDATFSPADNKVVLETLDAMQFRMEMLKNMTVANEGPVEWVVELLTEDKSRWVNEYYKDINEAKTVPDIMKVIEEIDKKIDEIKDILEDNVTLRSFLRAIIKAGIITVGASVAGAAGAGVGIIAALANSSYINKGKSMLRQVQNELLTLRRKALTKREQLRKEQYADHRDEGLDNIPEDDDEESYGEESVQHIYDKLLGKK